MYCIVISLFYKILKNVQIVILLCVQSIEVFLSLQMRDFLQPMPSSGL